MRQKDANGVIPRFVKWANAVPMSNLKYFIDVKTAAGDIPNQYGNW